MISIIDYGMGNLGSVLNMLKRAGCKEASITDDPNIIEKSNKIILPGVGYFDKAMESLNRKGLIPILEDKVLRDKTPIMGICLGMQLLFSHSEEGDCSGLGWIKGNIKKFNFDEKEDKYLIPHMGWNIAKRNKESLNIKQIQAESRFYFVHSYYAVCTNEKDILMTTEYGNEFVSGVESNNILGYQFHPEKSHRYGLNLFKNFISN